MRNNKRVTLLFVIGAILTLGLAGSVFAAGGDKNKKKQPKNTGILSVTTTPKSLPVRVDGQMVGMSGVAQGAEFYLRPGLYLVEVEGPGGQTFRKEVEIRKNRSSCICLNVYERPIPRPCPYDMRVDGPASVMEGDLATFTARNIAAISSIEEADLSYDWRVQNGTVTSGFGTESITVDTTGLGGRTLLVELVVTDGVYDASCRQRIAIDTEVRRFPKEKPPVYLLFDEFPFRAFDEDKARMDNLAIELQNDPNMQGYIIMYQGTDKRSQTSGDVGKLSQRALNYLVKTRGVDPSRIQIVRGGTRPTTTYQFWLIPPGAELPVPN